MNNIILKYSKINIDSTPPIHASETAAGFDLSSNINLIIAAGDYKKIPTGLKLEIPENYWGLIKSRSGLITKYGLEAIGGVIDQDYTGEIFIILHNISKKNTYIFNGMRIAQICIIPSPSVVLCLKETTEERKTKRGEQGFGSTGIARECT